MSSEEKEPINPQEDFKDFDEETTSQLPELEEDLMEEEENSTTSEIDKDLEEEHEETHKDINHDFSHKFDDEHQLEEIHEKLTTDEKEQGNDEIKQDDLSSWEEYDEENLVVKKYIFHISKDFIPFLDSLSPDKRSAYINDAIQTKMDLENIQKQKNKKRKIVVHFIIMILTICISMPAVLLGVHKAIMATFENYKYSQDNFEKLYKQRFAKDKAYLRSIQYNKEIKLKSTKTKEE